MGPTWNYLFYKKRGRKSRDTVPLNSTLLLTISRFPTITTLEIYRRTLSSSKNTSIIPTSIF